MNASLYSTKACSFMAVSDYTSLRRQMIKQQLMANGVTDGGVLNAFARLPRHEFVARRHRRYAYSDHVLSVGYGQQMMSPVMMAQALQALRFSRIEKVLEVGTGSGYGTALLMQLSAYVYSLERVPQLAETASARWPRLGLQNVDLHIGDGSQGLPDMASFDVIMVTAYVEKIPKPLALQLHPLNGRMIIPIGNRHAQKLKLIRREADHWYARTIRRVQLPPLIGRFGARPSSANV